MAEQLNLNNMWEWNPITGNPFIPPDESPNSRHCPTLEEMDEVVNTQHKTGTELRRRLLDFMTSNETHLTTQLDIHASSILRGYLNLLRALQFKKIHVEYVAGGKVNMAKLPRDTPFVGEPDGIVNHLRTSKNHSCYRLVDDINHNAMLGWLGPGTYPCCKPLCNLCTYVGRSSTVNLGPHGHLQLTKRAYCFTRTPVYVGVCQQCEEEDTFTCYFGESARALNQRCADHHNNACNRRSIFKTTRDFPTSDHKHAEVARVIAAGSDPQNVLRDWFSHITDTGIHPGQQRMSVVDIIPHIFLRKNRERNLVAEHMFQNGDFHYLGMGRGCLNTYAE